ncbi:hypothetical protein ACJBU6_05949 [Exserohilum turcicum]
MHCLYVLTVPQKVQPPARPEKHTPVPLLNKDIVVHVVQGVMALVRSEVALESARHAGARSDTAWQRRAGSWSIPCEEQFVPSIITLNILDNHGGQTSITSGKE